MSKARLAAEAAFSSPPTGATPQGRTQIIVRRARIAFRPPSIAPDDSQPEAKPAPRVFRVDAAPAAMPEREASSPRSVGAAGNDAAPARPARPKRRQVADQRPGPVVHLARALPARPDDQPTAQQLTELAAALANIDPVFQAIRRAQAFVFIDGSFASQWRALSERASALRAELHAPRTSPRQDPWPAR